MFCLEKDARKWFRGLPPKSIFSLKYFHSCFHNHCRLIYQDKIIFEHFCSEESQIEHNSYKSEEKRIYR
jgi:hypothetical protein